MRAFAPSSTSATVMYMARNRIILSLFLSTALFIISFENSAVTVPNSAQTASPMIIKTIIGIMGFIV